MEITTKLGTDCESPATQKMADNGNQNAPAVNVPDDAPLRRAGYKDLSLVSLVPRWSGGESAPPIQEFFDTIEGSAVIGNWTQADIKQVSR